MGQFAPPDNEPIKNALFPGRCRRDWKLNIARKVEISAVSKWPEIKGISLLLMVK